MWINAQQASSQERETSVVTQSSLDCTGEWRCSICVVGSISEKKPKMLGGGGRRPGAGAWEHMCIHVRQECFLWRKKKVSFFFFFFWDWNTSLKVFLSNFLIQLELCLGSENRRAHVYRNQDCGVGCDEIRLYKEARRGVLYLVCYHSRRVWTDIPNAQLTVEKPNEQTTFSRNRTEQKTVSTCSNSNHASLHINITLAEQLP